MPVQVNSYGKCVLDFWDFVDVEVTATGTVTITVKAGDIVEQVIAKVLTAYDSATSASLIVGDGTDPDGLLVAADAKAAAGTVYGDAVAEVGAYLKDSYATTPAVASRGLGKAYAADDTIDATITIVGATTVGKVRVYARILRLYTD